MELMQMAHLKALSAAGGGVGCPGYMTAANAEKVKRSLDDDKIYFDNICDDVVCRTNGSLAHNMNSVESGCYTTSDFITFASCVGIRGCRTPSSHDSCFDGTCRTCGYAT